VQTIFLYLSIQNHGKSAAKNLKLSLDRDFYQAAEEGEGKNIRMFPTFQRTIPSFAPGEEIFILISQGFNLGKANGEGKLLTPYEFVIDATYDFAGKTFHQRHEVDLSAYMQTSQDRNEMLEELEKIRKALERRAQQA